MKISIYLGDFIESTLGTIYYLAPYHKPRHIDEIVDSIIENFKAEAECSLRLYYHDVELKDLYGFISDILMPIDRFRELNLSQREYDNGIGVDDENRQEFVFTSMYTDIPDYDNFIDLDACIQNIFCKFEHNAYRAWANGDINIKNLIQFRDLYKNAKE